MTLRFIGFDSQVGDAHLESFGQAIELNDADAVNAIKGGAAIIPEADYKACGFTGDEEREFKVPGTHDPDSDDPAMKTFLAKKFKAALRFSEFHYGNTAALLKPVAALKPFGGEI